MAPKEDESTDGDANTVNWEGDIHGSPNINISQVNIEGVPAKEHAKVLEELKELKKELDSGRGDINVVQGRKLFKDRNREPNEEELESARNSVRIANKLVQQGVKFEPWDLLSFALTALSLADDTEGEIWGDGMHLLAEADWEFEVRREIINASDNIHIYSNRWDTQEEFWERQFESHEENPGEFFTVEFSEIMDVDDGLHHNFREEENRKRRELKFKFWYREEVARGLVECNLHWAKVLLLQARDRDDFPRDWRESYAERSRIIQGGHKEDYLQNAETILWEAYTTLPLKCSNTYMRGRNRGEERYVERKMGEIMCLLAEIASERGEFDSARRIFQEAYSIAFGTGYWRLEYQILRALADLAVQQGDAGEAERNLDESIVLSNKHRDWYGERRGLIKLAELADQQGDAEKAEEIRSAIELRRVQHYTHEVE